MGLEFIDRLLKTSAILLLIFVPFGLYYMGVYPALAVFSGAVWGMLNLVFLARLARAVFRPEGANVPKAILAGLFKFPLLYAAGYFLLKIPQFDPIHLTIGFSSLLAIIVLKVVGMVLFGTKTVVTVRPDGSKSVRGLA